MDDHHHSSAGFPGHLPEEIPVMTLPRTVLFPQAMLPLYIFEPRYRQMVQDVLNSNRIFAVASLVEKNPSDEESEGNEYFEESSSVATAGIIRACHENEDGTSNLILQGLARVRFERVVAEIPYRRVAISLLKSTQTGGGGNLPSLRAQCLQMIDRKLKLGPENQREAFRFLEQIHDSEAFVDLASFSMVDDMARKQLLLETLGIEKRYELFVDWLQSDLSDLELYQRLKGRLKDEDISNN